MRIEVTIAKTTALPPGAIDALADELSRRIHDQYPDSAGRVSVRYAASNNLSVIGGIKEDKELLLSYNLDKNVLDAIFYKNALKLLDLEMEYENK